MKYNEMERESIQLKVIADAIDEMINHEVLKAPKTPKETFVNFPSYTHKKYFNILLVDFLSNIDKDLFGRSFSCLKGLREISDNPCFNIENSIALLKKSVHKFKNWLEEEIEVETWLPTIDVEATIKVRRLSFIKICGNNCKHNMGRLTKTAEDLRRLYKSNGHEISFEDSLLALEDFHERFHDDILSYHASTISEMLNNIRWDIHYYLLPEFKRSHKWTDKEEGRYEYLVPSQIQSKFALHCYWELMNIIRKQPYVVPFLTDKHFKMAY